MNSARAVVGWVGVSLMAGGYFASVFFALTGDPAPYVKALDASAVPLLALGLVVVATICAFIPSSSPESTDEGGQT